MKASTEHWAEFRAYGQLNDFLPASKRHRSIRLLFTGYPGIKDVIEAAGIPHTEVDLILVNDRSVGFSYNLKSGDRVAVFPHFQTFRIDDVSRVKEPEQVEKRFVLDVHLGKLSRYLRLLGFDVLYENDFSDREIVRIAAKENRIVLTRDIGILKNKKVRYGYWVRSTVPKRQVREVVERFDLVRKIKAFQRCLECNALIERVEKKEVASRLPSRTKTLFQEFYRCPSCNKIYWEGSHFDSMKEFLKQEFGI